jgi:hypothetical protein
VALTITKSSGEIAFHGLAPFTSGTGIGRASIFRSLEHGEEIRVTASKAPSTRKKSR